MFVGFEAATTFNPQPLQATPTKNRHCNHQPKEKKPAAHFSTFGFAQKASRPFAKPKELIFFNTLLHFRNLFLYLPISVKSK